MNSIWVWENNNATDEEIANCNGDYYGCEICKNRGRCIKMTMSSLTDAITEARNKTTRRKVQIK